MAAVTPIEADNPSRRASNASLQPASIATALNGHRNSLGVIRLVLAALVIFDHAFPLGGFGEDPFWELTRGQTSLGGIAVGGFFAVSGYLIAKSAMTTDILQFIWRRIIRIFPAFWGVLIFGAFVIGPIAWTVRGSDLASYFTLASDGPIGYLVSNWTLTINAYGIYNIFIGTPYGELVGGSVLNGSLWTLAYEWGCYLLIGVLAASGILVRARIMVPILTGFMVFASMMHAVAPGSMAVVLPILSDPQVLFLVLAFLVGSSIGVYADRVPYSHRIGVLSLLVFLSSAVYGGFAVFGVIAGGYAVLYLAARLPRSVQWIGGKNDYSYGVYVYGFLVQQCLAAANVQQFGYVVYALSALLITFALAWISWHGIEKRALALKSWGPGRGVEYWRENIGPRLRGATHRGSSTSSNHHDDRGL